MAVDRFLQVLDAAGAVQREVSISDGRIEIGRTGSGIACPEDADMADRQAEIELRDGRVMLRDSGEGSGVWLRVDRIVGRLLRGGDQVWLGSQILVPRRVEQGWEIRHHGPDGRLKSVHALPPSGLFIGRTSDLVLDAEDSRLSRRHAQLVLEGDDLRLYDRGAHNGTYLRLTQREPEPLSDGDEFRIAAHRFRLVERSIPGALEDRARLEPEAPSETHNEQPRRVRGLAARLRRLGSPVRRRSAKDARPASGVDALEASMAQTAIATHIEADADASPGQPVEGEGASKVLVVLDSDSGSVSIEVAAGRTILDAVREAGLERGEPVDWECGDGGCGVCVLGVVEGADRMDPPDPATGEMKTIQITEQVVPDPNRYRLACLARVRGTVRLRKLT